MNKTLLKTLIPKPKIEIEKNVECVEEFLIPLWDKFQYFDHQVNGIRWMLEKEKIGTEISHPKRSGAVTVRGGLQCDEMGLGKTIQVIGTMVNNPLPITLLLAPLAMIETWTNVCRRAGMGIYHAMNGQWFPVGEQKSITVYITNFEKLYTTPRLFRNLILDRVVLDEAHKIRNPDGQMAIYARRLVAPIRWAVTGTPLVNNWKDVVSLLAFIGVPCSPLWKWEEYLEKVLPLMVLHRSLESLRNVLDDAPPYPITHHMKLPFNTEKEREFYLAIQGATIAMAGASRYDMDRLTPQQAFQMLLRLRQISVHPQVYISAKRREMKEYIRKDWIGPSTKLLAIKEILLKDKGAEKEAHKYIIFCQFKEEMELIHKYLCSLNLFHPDHILEYDGSLTHEQRIHVLQKSKDIIEPSVLLLQLQAGGVGLNLQEYDRIIFNSPWWTSALMDQAIARAVRMGQKRIVHIYHLHLEAEDNDDVIFIDQLINNKAEAKRQMLLDLFALCDGSIYHEEEDLIYEE